LAISLARQDRAAEAIQVCLTGSQTDKSAAAGITMARILVCGQPTAENFRLAEPLLADAVKSHNDNSDLLVAVANVRTIQQRFDDARALNRRALELKPNHLMALNNQATLMAETPSLRQEALEYIERAIEVAGPQPMFLDTKGTILLYDGKPSEAVPLLEKAVSAAKRTGPDPRYRFHLALAYDRLEKKQQAGEVLRKSREDGLTNNILTPTDQKLLQELEQKQRP
jgi:tetratricopeptide (TPR) repeat protein